MKVGITVFTSASHTAAALTAQTAGFVSKRCHKLASTLKQTTVGA